MTLFLNPFSPLSWYKIRENKRNDWRVGKKTEFNSVYILEGKIAIKTSSALKKKQAKIEKNIVGKNRWNQEGKNICNSKEKGKNSKYFL